MIELNIPGFGNIKLEHLVCDVNGTLAVDGILQVGVKRKLSALRGLLTVHLLTADTHRKQLIIDRQLNLEAVRVPAGNEADYKASYVKMLDSSQVIAIGQGANDAAMLKVAAIGICVLSEEGVAVESLVAADLVTPDINAALDMLEKPLRLVASLRR